MLTRIIRSVLILCLCTLALCATASAQDTTTTISQHKRELIQELIAVTISQVNVDAMIDEMLRQEEDEIPKQIAAHLEENKELTPDEREKMRREQTAKSLRFSKRFRELLPQRINMRQEIEAIAIALYDKYFTEDEIAQIVTFHKSPAGRKMTEMMPKFLPDMMRKIQDSVAPKMESLIKELMAEEEKLEKQSEGEVTTVPE